MFEQAVEQLKEYDTYMNKEELRLLYHSVFSLQRIPEWVYRYQRPQEDNDFCIVDLGTYQGMSAQVMAFALKGAGLEGKVYTVDIETSSRKFVGDISDRIEFWQMDAVKSAKRFEDNSIDFLFIDANHAYNHVYQTIKRFHPKMKKLHVMAGHDYSYFRGGGINVIRAVEDWKKRNSRKWTGFSVSGEIWRFLVQEFTVFACDRDHTVDVNQGPVPLKAIKKLALQKENKVVATGNQALKKEANIPGTVETVEQLDEDPSGWGRRQRVRRLEKLYPDADRYVVVDDVDLSDLEEHGWEYYSPQEFCKEVLKND